MSECDREAKTTRRLCPKRGTRPMEREKRFLFKNVILIFFHVGKTKVVRGETSDSPCVICDGQSVSGTGVSPGTSVLFVSVIPPMLYRSWICSCTNSAV